MKVEITDEAADRIIVKTCEEILSDHSWCWGLDEAERSDMRDAARVFLRYFGESDGRD